MKAQSHEEPLGTAATTSNGEFFLKNFHVSEGHPRTAQDHAYEAIRNAILRGHLPPGTKLNQTAVAERLGVSTTPVREALGRLVADGLAQSDAYRGAVVRGIDDNELREIYELRLLLEPFAAKKAAEHISASELNTAEELWHKMENYEDPMNWADLNLKFHAVIIAASRSPRLEKILNELLTSSARYVQWSLTKMPGRAQQANRDHWQLIEALRTQNAEQAAEIEAAHLTKTVEVLRSPK